MNGTDDAHDALLAKLIDWAYEDALCFGPRILKEMGLSYKEFQAVVNRYGSSIKDWPPDWNFD